MELVGAPYFFFLGAVALAHSLLPPRWRMPLLLGASLAFYAMSSVPYLVLYLLMAAANYGAAMRLGRDDAGPHRLAAFGVVLALDLATLIAFKYLGRPVGSLLTQLGAAGSWAGAMSSVGGVVKLAAPLGISYFTFQMVGCVTDAYRRDWKPTGGLAHFSLFGLFFPQITSGPIPRAPTLLPQLVHQQGGTAADRDAALRLIAYGLFKKFVVANRLGEYVGQVFPAHGDAAAPGYSSLPALLACIYNVLNLYADFSSYVDIAIGSARLLGIRLDPNFDRPLISTSVTEFWRRWHMTLSFWVRDYVFTPLVFAIGDIGSSGVVLALLVTFAIVGIWHGATWPYLVFGLLQGAAMSGEMLTKRWRRKRLSGVPPRLIAASGWVYTMSFVVLSQIFFRAPTLADASTMFSSLGHLDWAGAGEMYAHKGPFDFSLDLVAVALWCGVSRAFRRESAIPTAAFVLACALLVLFVGRLGSGQFIYAAF